LIETIPPTQNGGSSFGVVYRWDFFGHFNPWNSYLIVHFQLDGLTVSTVFSHERFVQRGELFPDIIEPLFAGDADIMAFQEWNQRSLWRGIVKGPFHESGRQ
jgi:hypothetical protein